MGRRQAKQNKCITVIRGFPLKLLFITSKRARTRKRHPNRLQAKTQKKIVGYQYYRGVIHIYIIDVISLFPPPRRRNVTYVK